MIARFFFLSILLAYCKSAPAGNPCVDGTGGISADPNDKSKFLKCHLDVAFSQSCPPGLVFNSDANICDWPSIAGVADTRVPATAATVPNSQAEFSNLNFGSQTVHTTTFEPITTTTQFTFSTTDHSLEFSNLNFGSATIQASTSFSPITFASATESSNQFLTSASTTSNLIFETTSVEQKETTASFVEFNGINGMASNVVQQTSRSNRPKETVVNNFIFEEIDKNNRLKNKDENDFVQATQISNIALIPTVALPKKTKDDKKVKISVSDLSSLFQKQTKTQPSVAQKESIEPEQKLTTTTNAKASTTQSTDYDYDYEEVTTTLRPRIRTQHTTITTSTQVTSTTTSRETTIVNNMIFEKILRNPTDQNEQTVTNNPDMLLSRNSFLSTNHAEFDASTQNKC
ncbi:hypothetical protein BpHYR1_013595 [Brachionus plicatilis]|uniref:Chitin-binding type-2 domain-containing protein n=1 Tax=Brachionus plicatilis TaxID=10195 RepID=A0A3M7R012_BRAPC|nr:hypothetical protein BpHYR1_013595 [Brachionus plicatilis]